MTPGPSSSSTRRRAALRLWVRAAGDEHELQGVLVVGVDELLPQLGVVVELLGREPDQVLAVSADVLVARRRQHAVAIADDVADRLEQVAKTFGLRPVVAAVLDGHRSQRYRPFPARAALYAM